MRSTLPTARYGRAMTALRRPAIGVPLPVAATSAEAITNAEAVLKAA